MALVTNYSLASQSPTRRFATGVSSGFSSDLTPPGSQKNRMFGGFDKFNGTPWGYSHPTAWVLPLTDGGMATVNNVNGTGDFSGTANSGINLLADLAGTGTVTNADLKLIIALSADLAGTGTISNAALDAVASLAATLAGSGVISDAALNTIVGLTASLSGSGTVAGGFTGALYMTADITPFADLSPQSIAAEILDASDIETGYSTREALRLILASIAGKLSGAGTATITIRNVPDSKSRIVATVDSNGNRTAVTYDVAD